MSNKLGSFISSPSIENFRSGWNLLEAMSGLIDEDEENQLKDRLFVALAKHDLFEGNEEFAIEIVDSVSPKEERMEFEQMLFREFREIGQYKLAVSNALKDLNVDVKAMGKQLLLMTGIFNQEQLEKAKARLLKYGEIEEHFEIDSETGGLLVGPIAKQYASFVKKIEEIFGATPRGDVEVGDGAIEGLFTLSAYPEKVKARLFSNGEMTATVAFEWSRELGYGAEITLKPVNNPHNDYYGIWVSQHEEGPKIGKLNVKIQNTADELGLDRIIAAGLTVEEMHEEVWALTGVDLDEIR